MSDQDLGKAQKVWVIAKVFNFQGGKNASSKIGCTLKIDSPAPLIEFVTWFDIIFWLTEKPVVTKLRKRDFLFRINIKGAVKFLRHILSSSIYNVINQKYAKKSLERSLFMTCQLFWNLDLLRVNTSIIKTAKPQQTNSFFFLFFTRWQGLKWSWNWTKVELKLS